MLSNLSIAEHPADADVKDYYIVQFTGAVKPEWKEHLRQLNCEIYDYIPDNAFVVRMDSETKEIVQDLDFVQWIGIYQPAYKISPELPIDEEAINITVLLFRPEKRDEIASRIEDLNGEIVKSIGDVIILIINTSKIEEIAKINDVEWIEEYIQPQILNDVSRWVIQSYVNESTPIWDHNLTGAGQIVGISDSGLDYDSCFFWDSVRGAPPEDSGLPSTVTPDYNQRKVIVYHDVAEFGDYDDDYPGHGTHTSGSIAGDNLATIGGYDTNDGMAYNAKLVFQDLGQDDSPYVYPPADLNDLFQQAYDDGARIHSNSWGSSAFGVYTTDSKQCDEFMWNHKDFLILFANGNDGPDSNTVGSPATAKNVVSVGATENGARAENMAFFSSHGPTDDGRIKPTVCAPGVYIWSADSDGDIASYNCDVVSMSGTSMSTPTTAGAAALIRQYFIEGYYPGGNATPGNSITPSAALIKAMLVSSGEEMNGSYTEGPIPSNGQGWGRILLDNALYFDGDSRRLEAYDSDSVNTGQSKTYNIAIDNQSEPLKIILVWTDYPSTPAAAINLVNDLNLVVMGPGGIYLENDSMETASDNRNVVESVYVETPSAGAYTITVTGYNVPEGPQPFALVITGGLGIGSKGIVYLDKDVYNCSSVVNVTVKDADLNADNTTIEEAEVSIMSFPTEITPENIRLTETGVDTATFTGSIRLTTSAPVPDGNLSVSHGDLITVFYVDADDGTGNPVTVHDTAMVDCIAPVIIVTTPQNDTTYNSNAVALNYSVNEKTAWEGYRLDAQPVVIISGNTTLINLTDGRHNVTVFANDIAGNIGASDKIWFNITTPDIWVYPEAFEVILPQGNITNRTLTIGNNGSGVLEFEISDVAGTIVSQMEVESMEVNPEYANINTDLGITTTKTYNYRGTIDSLSILLYTDDYVLPFGFTYPELALQELGYSYTATDDPEYFYSLLLSETWDMVIVDHNSWYSIGNYWPDVENFVNSGGLCIVTTFDVDGSDSVPTTLWNTLGATWASNIFMPENVYKWDLSHPVFTTPETVPDFTYWEEGYFDDGDKTDPLVSAIAGFTTSSSSDQAAIIVGNEGRTILNSFLICEDRGDMDSDGVLDAIELWKNEITYVLVGGADWLTEHPQNGTISPSNQTNITVTFNATDLDIGKYNATIVIASNDPDESKVEVPVRLILTQLFPPDIWVEPLSFNVTAFQGEVKYENLTIGNNGTGDLVFNISDVRGTTSTTKSTTKSEPVIVALMTLNDEVQERNIPLFGESYMGTYLYFDISSYGEIMPFQYPIGTEHLRSGFYGDGYTVAYNDGTDRVAWAGYDSRYGITPVSYREIENTPTRLVVEVVTRTSDGLLEITHLFTFDKDDKYIRVQPTVKNIGSSALTNVVYKRWADWDMDWGASHDTFNYDAGRNMIYAYDVHYAAIASETPPDYRDIDGWDDYERRITDEDYTTGPIMIDGLEILHHELGTLSSSGTTSLTFVYGAGDDLLDLQGALDRAFVVDWLSVTPTSGIVLPKNQTNLSVEINTTSLEVGTYNATIIITHNDILHDTINIPVNLNLFSAPHDIAVTNITAPDSAEINSTIVVNSAISNQGSNDEFNIIVDFIVDGITQSNITVPYLASMASTNVSFTWTAPGTPGIYNLTIYAEPVPDENITGNNQLSKNISVITIPDIWVSPAEFNLTLEKGKVDNRTLTIGNNGTGILNASLSTSLPTDIDLDNEPEIIVRDCWRGYTYVVNNSNLDTFNGWEWESPYTDWYKGFAIADVNGDGIPDLVEGGNNYLRVYDVKNNVVLYDISISCCSYGGTAAGDIDNDGTVEMLVSDYDGYIYVYDGKTGLPDAQGHITYPTAYYGTGLGIGDIDNDGIVEVVRAGYDGIDIFNGETRALETEISIYPLYSYPDLVFGDANGNGIAEIYVGGEYGYVYAYEWDGTTATQLWQSSIGYWNWTYTRPCGFADADNDGDFEIFIGNSSGYITALNALTGGIEGSAFTGYYSYVSCAVGDIDKDGVLELATGNYDGYIRTYTYNNGLFTLEKTSVTYYGSDLGWATDSIIISGAKDPRVFREVSFIQFDETEVSVPPDSSHNVTVTFNATNQNKGTYNATIVINSNDPDESIVNVPVHLSVITPPHIISFSPTDLTPTQYVGNTYTFNVTTDQLMASNSWIVEPEGVTTLGNGTSSLTLTWDHAGVYNITYIGTNEDGSVNITWMVTVPSPKPDLMITEKWVCWPDNCTICYKLTNVGYEIAPAGHNTTLYVDGDKKADDYVPVVLERNKNYTGCFNYNWSYTPPEDNITICADHNNTIEESNESNNCAMNMWICGDLDGDHAPTFTDARIVACKALGRCPEYPDWHADVDGDHATTFTDARIVACKALGECSEYTCGCSGV